MLSSSRPTCTPLAMSGDCSSKADRTLHVLKSKPACWNEMKTIDSHHADLDITSVNLANARNLITQVKTKNPTEWAQIPFSFKSTSTFGWVVISNVFDCVPDDLLVVDVGLGADFSQQHDHTSLGSSLTGYLSIRVLLEMGIQDSIAYLITYLICKWQARGFKSSQRPLVRLLNTDTSSSI